MKRNCVNTKQKHNHLRQARPESYDFLLQTTFLCTFILNSTESAAQVMVKSWQEKAFFLAQSV